MNRFVLPSTTTLTLANGDTITVRTRLNAGEHRAHMQRSQVVHPDGTSTIDAFEAGRSLVLAYLVDWRFADDGGPRFALRDEDGNVKPIEAIASALDRLDLDDFIEIKQAIEAHQAAVDAQRAQEKKLPAGSPATPAISPSPFVAAGASSGSAS